MKKNCASLAAGPVTASPQSDARRPQRILVVDDHCDIRQLSTELLIACGYEADAVADGDTAWQALNKNCYDLLITDHKMPRMSGTELLSKLRIARMELPVILTSSAVPPEELMRHEWLQPAVTLPKPYTVAEFLGAVRGSLCATSNGWERKEPLSGWQNQPSEWVRT